MAKKPTKPVYCSVVACEKVAKSRGLCDAHWKRWRRYGDPLAGRTPDGAPLQFVEDVLRLFDLCLPWPFSTTQEGRGLIRYQGRMRQVSNLVCELAHGPAPTPRHEAAHSCGKGHEACINPKHLRWATRTENSADMIAHGTTLRGTKHPSAKLTEDDVATIRGLRGLPLKELAARFGVSRSTISAVQTGKGWSGGA